MSRLVEDITGNELTFRIIGAAMTVHNSLGAGYKEEIYEKALELELNRQEIACVRQYPVNVHYIEMSLIR
jgi:GxxExxY protein